MKNLNIKQEHRAAKHDSNIILENSLTVRTNKSNRIDNLKTGNLCHHANIVWDTDGYGNTVVYCGDCHEIIYDGEKLLIT
ncbi:MAG: hypothetical protein ACE5J2_00610 [Nitrososphaerales archaeon]